MPHLEVDFTDVPDEILPIEPGIYEAEITEAPEILPTKSGEGTKLVVQMTVVGDDKNSGRRLSDHISTKMQTRIKRLIKSAGLTPGSGFDTEDLAGQRVKIRVKQESYQVSSPTLDDPDNMETRTASRVDDYLFDS